MCGLLASTGKAETHILRALGCLSARRGVDSAGIAWWTDKAHLCKVAAHPSVAFNLQLAPYLRAATWAGVPIIGHTRQASQGKVCNENAHPFIDDHSGIAWAHNGVLTNDQEFGKYEVDSMALIHGIKPKDFSKFKGSIALVWLEAGQLHAYRKGNPLFRGTRKKAVYLASERSMLSDVGCEKIKELSEGSLYRWKDTALEEVRRIPANSVYAGGFTTAYTSDDTPSWKSYRTFGSRRNRSALGERPDWVKNWEDAHQPSKALTVVDKPLEAIQPEELDKIVDESKVAICIECGMREHGIAMDVCDQCATAWGYGFQS